MNLAGSMRRLRLASDMTLREVADRAGLQAYQVHRCENGLRPPLSVREQARIFGVSESEVLKPCQHCRYQPPAGYMCLTCRTRGES